MKTRCLSKTGTLLAKQKLDDKGELLTQKEDIILSMQSSLWCIFTAQFIARFMQVTCLTDNYKILIQQIVSVTLQ